jgi:hypothetical protein
MMLKRTLVTIGALAVGTSVDLARVSLQLKEPPAGST